MRKVIKISTVNYFAYGYVVDIMEKEKFRIKIADHYNIIEEENYRCGWFAIFNPNNVEAKFSITFYYEDQEPTKTEDIRIPSKVQKVLDWEILEEIVRNKHWGAKIESNMPLICQASAGTCARYEKDDRLFRSHYTTMAATDTSTLWAYPDGVYICPPTSWSKRMLEPEFVGILNPNEREAEITITTYHADSSRRKYKLKVPANRYKWIDMYNVVGKNPSHFGARFISTEPIVVQQDRPVYDAQGSPVQRSDFNEMCIRGASLPFEDLEGEEGIGAYNVGYFPGPNSLLVLFNPSKRDTMINITFYYEHEEPNECSTSLKAQTSLAFFELLGDSSIISFSLKPERLPSPIKAEIWGCKVSSTEPLFMQDLCGSGYYYKPSKEDLDRKPFPESVSTYREDIEDRLTWNMASRHAATCPSKIWYYADGFLHKPPSEYSKKLIVREWIWILNPSKRDAEIALHIYQEKSEKNISSLKVSSERIAGIDMEKVVAYEKDYGVYKRYSVKIISSEPIVVSHNRGIFKMGDPIQREVAATMAQPEPLIMKTI
jgi:hypothetical protein